MSDMVGDDDTYANISDHCDAISRQLKERSETIYLVIHNIDGLALRLDKAQVTLAQLAASPNVKMVASFDHINTPLLWDSNKAGFFFL